MHKVLWAFVCLIVVVLGALGGVLAFDAPVKPPPLASISDPFADVDFSDLPTVQTYAARDGAKLGYRVYEGGGTQVVVLIHGSSDDGTGMHPLAKALRDAGASVYVPVVRGHGDFGRKGDIDYIGQLEDDLADFVAVLRPLHPNASFSLIGFSSGGGFVLRVIATPDEKLFDRFIMISPALPPERTDHPARHGRLGFGGEAAHHCAGDVKSPRHPLVQRASHSRFRDLAQGSESHQRLFVPACGRFRRAARLSGGARPQQEAGRTPRGRRRRVVLS